MTKTLTPEQATTVVKNGGLVVEDRLYWWYGCVEYLCQNGLCVSEPSFHSKAHSPHPLYDPEVFARDYPCTLPGPEAKALLMEAPVGMLDIFTGRRWISAEEGLNLLDFSSWPEWEGWSFQIRLRPNWLESQRARFARGEFGETKRPLLPGSPQEWVDLYKYSVRTSKLGFIRDMQSAQEATRNHSIHFGPKEEPAMPRYIINGQLVTFPWKGDGPECVEIWNAMPKGLLEWTVDCAWETGPMLGSRIDKPYHLRIRYNAPKPGDVVDARKAWELCNAGWVTDSDGAQFALHDDGIRMLGEGNLFPRPMSGFADIHTLIRHEPWRCATLETGYCWSGEEAAAALKVGMEGLLQGGALKFSVRKVPDGYHRFENGALSDFGVWKLEAIKEKLWALRWPAKENDMLDLKQFPKTMTGEEAKALIMENEPGLLEGRYAGASKDDERGWGYKRDDGTFDDQEWQWNYQTFTVRVRNAKTQEPETLTAGQALDALRNKEDLLNCNGVIWKSRDVHKWCCSELCANAPFTRVPRPDFIEVPLSCGIVAKCYKDRVVAYVSGCGVWTSMKERYETALKLEGVNGVLIDCFAGKHEGEYFTGIVNQHGITIEGRTITSSDIRACLDAMRKVEGGGE